MRSRRISLLLVGLAWLFGFALFSKYVDREVIGRLDFDTTVKIQDLVSRFPNRFSQYTIWENIGFLATPLVSMIMIVILTAAAFLNQRKWLSRLATMVIPVGFALLVLAEIYGKSVVHHPAPPFFMIKNPAVEFPRYYINEQYSYPSGHAARSMYIGIITVFLSGQYFTAMKGKNNASKSLRKHKNQFVWVILFSTLYIFLTAFSRIYLGTHWLSDIIGGWLVAAGSGVLVMGML